ncbi:hypothetical protein ACMDCT_08065 [Halomonadaceae bacterium KBTZ08]
MPLLISDANIFIDLEEGGLIAELFQLPHEIMTPDILYEDELDEQHAHLLEVGLRLGELTPDTVMDAYRLIETYRDPTKRRAESAWNRMKSVGRRLPWRQAFERSAGIPKGEIARSNEPWSRAER